MFSERSARTLNRSFFILLLCAAFLLAAGSLQAAIPASERNALLAFYNATNGANWTNSTNWLGAPGTECSWFGIACAFGPDTVVSISLFQNGLTGILPPELGDLQNLSNFFLQRNEVGGGIPAEIANLSKLQSFDVCFNRLVGQIPPEITQLTELKTFVLCSNQLTGPIPSDLGQLINLEFFIVTNNQLSGEIPASVSQLTNMRNFRVHGNRLSGPIPSGFSQMSQLEVLTFYSNQLTGPIPPELGNLTTLQRLEISNNQLSGPIPPELGNLTNLTTLWLNSNQLSGSIPPGLGNLTNLQDLRMSSNQLSGSIPPELGNLTNVPFLSLNSNQLSGSIPPELANLTNLRELHLSSNQLSGSIPPELGTLTNLLVLLAHSNQLSGSIPPELGNLANLLALSLRLNQLSGSIPPELGNLANLGGLELDSNQLSGSIPPELGNLTILQFLRLNSNQLSGSIPPELGTLTNLRGLFLSSNQLTGSIPSSLSNLTAVSFLRLDYNGLGPSDSSVKAWADARQPGWDLTQTVAPTNLIATPTGPTSIELTWSPIAYTGNLGRYEIYAAFGTNPFSFQRSTTSKSDSSATFTGLSPSTNYRFYLHAVTDPHGENQNQVRSEQSEIASTRTSDGGGLAITSVTPTSGPSAGGTPVVITGTGFAAGATVRFGGSAATNVVVISATQITAVTPPNPPGAVAVMVTNPDATTGSLPGAFTYCDPPSITSGPQDVPSSDGRAVLTVTAQGSGTLTYQWYRGASGDLSNPISGATSASLQTPPFSEGETSATWWVRVSNNCGAVNSRTAVVGFEDPCASLQLDAVAFDYRGETSGCAPGAVSCVAHESIRFTSELAFNGPGSCEDRVAEMSTFAWSFGDGSSSSERQPSKVFTGSGPFTVTLTVTHPSGQRQATRVIDFAPRVVITHYPEAIVGSTSGGDTTSFTVSNIGGSASTVNLTRQGTFFAQSPESFTLEPGASQTITVTTLALPDGRSEGTSVLSGDGVLPGTFVPIVALGVAPPEGDVIGVALMSRVDVSSPIGAPSAEGTASFTNTGSAGLTGVLSSDTAWLLPSPEVVTISPGGTVDVAFAIDPALRPDGGESGTFVAKLSLVYRLGTDQLGKAAGMSSPIRPRSGSGSGTASVGISHTATAAAQVGQAPPLIEGEVAIFLPGIAHVQGSVGRFISDLTLTSLYKALTVRNLQMFFRPLGATTFSSQPPFNLAANKPLTYGDIARSVFGNTTAVGSLQLRGNDAGAVAASANVFNASNPAGTYGTTIPAFRSDRSAGPNEKIFLTGLLSSPTTHTNLYIQEASGHPANAQIEFFSAEGVPIESRIETLEAFGLRALNSSAPVGSVSTVITTTGDSEGRLLAYATPVDRASGDTWAVVDWPRYYGYASSEPVLIPVAASLQGANNTHFRTDVAIMNSGEADGSGTMQFYSRTGVLTERTITLPSSQSMMLNDVVAGFFGVTGDDAGYIVFTPDVGGFALTSRTYTTLAGQPATFGSGVPTMPLSSGMRLEGETRKLGGVSDASLTTVQAGTPGTFRTNAGLVETSGQPVTVRATLRYISGTQNTSAYGIRSANFQLGPRQFLQINNISHAIFGPDLRNKLGDLSNMQLEFEVIAGQGTVVAFTSTLDNGTGDSILRVD